MAVMKAYQNSEDIHGDARAALIDLLYRLADDDLIVGHRHSEWTGLAPILEADIAFSSIAQDQIGQALAYYKLLHELGEPDPDVSAFARSAEQYRCADIVVLGRGNWAFSVVRQWLYDTAKSVRVEALCKSTYQPLAALSGKIRGEQKYHLMHAHMWVTRLGKATDESHELMRQSLNELYPYALGMFDPSPRDSVIEAEGLGPTEDAVREAWQAAIEPLLHESGLSIPGHAEPVCGGRRGQHAPELQRLLNEMQKVYRLDAAATW